MVHFGNQEYHGLSTDIKPVPADTAVGATYEETDTGILSINNGSTWNFLRGPPTNIGPERWYIYRTGSGTTGPYKAFNKRTGVVVYSGSSLDAVLDPVLVNIEAGDQGSVTTFVSSGGHVYIDGTDVYYDVSAGFDGFTIPQYTLIEGPHNARIRVPNAYTGYVFRIPSWRQINSTKYTSSTQACHIKGMSLHEDGTPVKDWTGILLEAWAEDSGTNPNAGGIAGCSVIGTRINNAKVGLKLQQLNILGWVTTCYFEKMYVTGPKWAGVEQVLLANPTNTFNNNVYRDIAIQSASATSPQTGKTPVYGFRNAGHERCVYDNCMVWDVGDGQIKCQFDATTSGGLPVTKNNVIIGGILADSTVAPGGTFSASNILVVNGYYSASDPYPAQYVDGPNTAIFGDYIVGNQFSKIYVPATGGLGGTGLLSVEGRSTTANLVFELMNGSDSVATIQSLYNKTRSERFSINRGTASTVLEQIKQTAGGTLRPIIFRMNDVGGGTGTFQSFQINTNGDIQITDARNIILATGTGTKIGTATTQKLGFFNKTPIAQPAAITSPDTSGAQLKTAVDAIRAALTALGLTA